MACKMLLHVFLVCNMISYIFGTDMYFVSTSKILKTGNTEETLRHQPNGQIIGLAVDTHKQYMFWSEMEFSSNSMVIYRSKLDGTNHIRIIEQDLGEVVGLAVDWSSSHIYWTDTHQRMIEVAEYDGTNRHVIAKGLMDPRAVLVNPIHRYLYWGDQGTHAIHRSYLDGTGAQVFIQSNSSTFWPNQLAINYQQRQLYWADAWSGSIWSCDLDSGSNCSSHGNISGLTNDTMVFGAAVLDNIVYTTSLSSQTIYKFEGDTTSVNDTTADTGSLLYLVLDDVNTQPVVESCESVTSCSHMCLWSDPGTGSRCHCPTYGGYLPISDTECSTTVEKFLVYVDTDSGIIGITSTEVDSPDTFILAKTNSPAAVTYDPVDQMVYFSDIGERAIYRVGLDGTGLSQVLNSAHGVGMVEGMSIDARQGRLYYTNSGLVGDDVMYTWHRIDMASINSFGDSKQPIRSVVTDVSKPRGLHVDAFNNKLYYSDWGKTPWVRSCDLDGQNGADIQMTSAHFENPNGLFFQHENLFIVDSHFETGGVGKIYRLNKDGTESVLPGSLGTPYDLTGDDTFLYITDWDESGIMKYNIMSRVLTKHNVHLKRPGGIQLILRTQSSSRDIGVCQSETNRCDPEIGICVLGDSTEYATCLCPTNQNKALYNERLCQAPRNYLLFADQEGIKSVSLDDGWERHVHLVIRGVSSDSNFVGLAYDERGNHIYFSDSYSQTIYKATPTGEMLENFITLPHTVENLAVSENILYWTTRYGENGTEENSIYSYPLDHSTPEPIRLVTGLVNPRGIVIDMHRRIFWTELETDTVWLKSSTLTGSDRQDEDLSLTYTWANGLSFDPVNRHLYFTVANEDGAYIYKCRVVEDSCVEKKNIGNTDHVFGIMSNDRFLYMTNWNTSSIERFDLLKQETEVVAQNLVRPAQVILINNDPIDSSEKFGVCQPLDEDCDSIECLSDWGCLGRQRCCHEMNCGQCVEPAYECLFDELFFSAGDEYMPNPCQHCICEGSGDMSCMNITCSDLFNCAAPVLPPGKCCEECRSFSTCDEKPVFFNCVDDLSFDLPANSKYITVSTAIPPLSKIYAISCANQRIDVNISETFHFDVSPQKMAIEVEDVRGKRSFCNISVTVRDFIPPEFTYCPSSIKVFSNDKTGTSVSWQFPQVTDNSGTEMIALDHESRPPNDVFPPGQHKVIYHGFDDAGNTADCEFVIDVELEDFPCTDPETVHNGLLMCHNSADNVLTCHIDSCHGMYVMNSSLNTTYECREREWSPSFPPLFSQQACLKPEKLVLGLNFKINIEDTLEEEVKQNVLNCLELVEMCPEQQTQYKGNYYLCEDKYLTVTTTSINGLTMANVSGSTSTFLKNLETREEATNNLIEINTGIFNFFKNGEFVKYCTDLPGVYSGGEMDVVPEVSCPPGQFMWQNGDEEICVKCVVGTRYDHKTKSCDLCPLNEYQDQEAQWECKPCPKHHITHKQGSYLEIDCIKPNLEEEESLTLIAIVGISVGGVVLCILIISLTVCFYKWRHRTDGGKPEAEDPYSKLQRHLGEEDTAYLGITEVYHEIPADQVDDTLATENFTNPVYDSNEDYVVPNNC